MSVLDTLKGLLGGVAPMVANAIIPGSGGLAKSIIGKVFGVDPSDEVALLDAVKNADPAQIIELKKAEMTHESELAGIAADLDKAFLAGTENARNRDTKLTLAGYHNYRADIMLAFAFGALCYIIWEINTNVGMLKEVLAIYNMAIGALLKMIGDAFQFEFGSSRGSKEKDKK